MFEQLSEGGLSTTFFEKADNAVNKLFLLFQQCFLTFQGKILSLEQLHGLIFLFIWLITWNQYYARATTDSKLSQGQYSPTILNPFPSKPLFLPVCSTSLLKTLLEKEKLLITSNFSFFSRVLYLFEEVSAIFIKFKIVVCKLFQFGRV